MKQGEEIVLKNVKEYCEGYDVTLTIGEHTGRLCVIALNEGGYNNVAIDAEQLYVALKNYFENE